MKSKKLMKNLVLACLISTFTFSFVACSKDNSTNNINDTKTEEKSKENIKIAQLDTKAVKDKISKKNTVIVDVRSDEEYNGWKIHDNVKGGHIRDAINFSYKWPDLTKNQKELEKLLKDKGITKDKEIIAYCNSGKKSLEFLNKLKNLGYTKLSNYKDGLESWSEDDSLKLVSYKNYKALVYPKWVKDLTDGKNPNTYPKKGYVILECNYNEDGIYKKGHIPKALPLDTNQIESKPKWNIVSDKKLEKLLNDYGITKDTTVIVYGNPSMGAERVAVAMMYAGVKDVRVLNGGKKAWKDAGYNLETKINKPTPSKNFGANIPTNPNYIINIPDAKKVLKDSNGKLVSVRTLDEFVGKTSGYSYFDRKGRIKGAVWCNSGKTSQDMSNFEDIDGTHRSLDEVEKYYNKIGLNKNNNISFYCGTGWRASLTFIDAYVLGWKNISVFDDGWFQWSLAPKNNPIEIGKPKK